MERTNSMSRGKRSLEGEEGQQQQQQPKRPALRRSTMASSSSNDNLSKMVQSLKIKLIKQKCQIELMKVQQEESQSPTKGISIKEANEPTKALRPKLPVNTGKGKALSPSQKGKKSTGKPTASSIHNSKPTAKQPSRKERTPDQAVLDPMSNQPLVQPSQKRTSRKERTPNHQADLASLSIQPLVQPSQKQASQKERTPNHQADLASLSIQPLVQASQNETTPNLALLDVLSNQPLVQPSQNQASQKERRTAIQAVLDLLSNQPQPLVQPSQNQASQKERTPNQSVLDFLSNQPLVQPSQKQASQKERSLIQDLLDLLSNQSLVQPSQPGVELSPETPNTSQPIKFIDRPRYFLNASNKKIWRLSKKSKVLAEHHEMLTETWNHIRAGTQDPNPVRRLEKAFAQVFELIQGIQNALKKQGEDPPCQSCCQPEPEVARPTGTGNH